MGDFVPVKTLRVMPMKFEFISDIYNNLALAYLESFEIPAIAHKLKPKEKLFLYFKLKEEETKPQTRAFGDKSSYIEQTKNEEATAAHR